MAWNIPPIIVLLFIAIGIVTIIDVATALIQHNKDRNKVWHHKSEPKLPLIPPET